MRAFSLLTMTHRRAYYTPPTAWMAIRITCQQRLPLKKKKCHPVVGRGRPSFRLRLGCDAMRYGRAASVVMFEVIAHMSNIEQMLV